MPTLAGATVACQSDGLSNWENIVPKAGWGLRSPSLIPFLANLLKEQAKFEKFGCQYIETQNPMWVALRVCLSIDFRPAGVGIHAGESRLRLPWCQ